MTVHFSYHCCKTGRHSSPACRISPFESWEISAGCTLISLSAVIIQNWLNAIKQQVKYDYPTLVTYHTHLPYRLVWRTTCLPQCFNSNARNCSKGETQEVSIRITWLQTFQHTLYICTGYSINCLCNHKVSNKCQCSVTDIIWHVSNFLHDQIR